MNPPKNLKLIFISFPITLASPFLDVTVHKCKCTFHYTDCVESV